MKFLIFSIILGASAHAKKLDTKVFFVEPADGATVSETFKVKMGVSGMHIEKAGEHTENKLAGHHHLLIDATGISAGQPIPTDPQHMHFGKGQTETELTLPPGTHKLTLQFADGAHISYGPAMSSTITVKVKPNNK